MPNNSTSQAQLKMPMKGSTKKLGVDKIWVDSKIDTLPEDIALS